MWGIIKPYLALLSVALNGAFMTAWLMHRTPRSDKSCCAPQPSGVQLLEDAGVDAAKCEAMAPRMADFRKSCQELCRQTMQRRRELIELLAASTPDRAAIRIKANEIIESQRLMQDKVVEQLLDEKAMLRPEEQKALFNLIRTRCCNSEECGK